MTKKISQVSLSPLHLLFHFFGFHSRLVEYPGHGTNCGGKHTKIRHRYHGHQLLRDNQVRDRAIGDLTGLVERSLDRPAAQQPRLDATPRHPIIQPDLIDNEGNLRVEDIGITWEGTDTFLHGVQVVGPGAAKLPGRQHPSTSTPYQPVREHVACDMSTRYKIQDIYFPIPLFVHIE